MRSGFNPNGYVVRISENALAHMCLCGLEAYSVRHRRKSSRGPLETYGELWGHETRMSNGQTLYAVELATVDTSTLMEAESVLPAEEALDLKRDITTSFWPQFDFLGDFHTHPYRSPAEVVGNGLKNYEYSDQDFNRVQRYPDSWQRHNYRVGMVLTIARMRRASFRDHRWLEDSTIEFTLGNYRLWLKTYVTFQRAGKLTLSAHDQPGVLLDCPALVGLKGEYTPFGRGVTGPGKRHKAGAIDMKPI